MIGLLVKMLYLVFHFFVFLKKVISQNSNLTSQIGMITMKYIDFNIATGDTDQTILNYPTNKGRHNTFIFGFSFYRNASWYYDGRAGSVVLTNDHIVFYLNPDYAYIKGLAAQISYN